MGGKNKEEDKMIKIGMNISLFLGGLLLLIFIISDLILQTNLKLTQEWLYVILGLFVVAIFPNVIKKTVERKVDEMLKDDYDVKNIFEELIKKSIDNEVDGIKKDISNLENRDDTSSVTLKEDDLKIKIEEVFPKEKVQNFINENILNFFKDKPVFEVQLRPSGKDFVIKNSKLQFIHFSYTNRKDILRIILKYGFLENDKSKFEKQLEDNGLNYFIDYLSSYNYNQTKAKYDENPSFNRIKLEISFDSEKIEIISSDKNKASFNKENFKKLLETVVDNNEGKKNIK